MTVRADVRNTRALTPRQMQCLELLWARFSAKQIAAELEITEDTVEAHLKQCRARLGTTSSMDAARLVFGKRDEVPVKPYYDPSGIPAGHHPLQFELTPNADGASGWVAGNPTPINQLGVTKTLAVILGVAIVAIVAVVLVIQTGVGIMQLATSMGF